MTGRGNMKIVGIDLAGLERNDTGFCVLEEKRASVSILHSDMQITAAIEREKPGLVCIDAPLTFPRGTERAADSALRKYGAIPPTTGGMVYLNKRGVALREALEKRFPLIEVFPTATAKILGYHDTEPSKMQKGLLSLGITGDPEKRYLTKDEADAISAALTGYLYLLGKTEQVGDEEGKITIPKG